MADVNIYGRLWCKTSEGEIASASQIKDPKWNDGTNNQSQINGILKTLVDRKQTTLVSGTNIKTINGASVLGQGDITIDLSLYKVVTALPTADIDDKKIYLVKNAAGQGNDVYSEYIYVTADKKWEKLGEYKSTVDLTPYALKADVTAELAKKADKETSYTKTEVDAKVKTVNDTLTAHTGNAGIHLTADEKAMLSDLDTLPADILANITAATQKADSVELELDLYHKGSSDGWQDDPVDPVVLKAATKDGAGVMTAADKVKLDGLKNYTLPAASDSELGGVVVGATSGLTVDEDGNLTVNRGAGNEVIEFDGTVDDEITVKANSAANYTEIVYSTTKNAFVAASTSGTGALGITEYFNNWPDGYTYGTFTANGWEPVEGTVYIDRSSNKIYRYDGTALVELAQQTAITTAELDKICV